MSETIKLKRRDLSGIYIFDKFPNEERRKPTYVEDCQQETRRKWCMSKDKDYLRETIKMLADSLKELADYLLQEDVIEEKTRNDIYINADDRVERSKCNWGLHELADQIDSLSFVLVTIADHCGVTKHNEEES